MQGPGTISASDWKTQKLWRSLLFPVHLVFSASVLLFRMFAIRIHERDMGTWIRKDWQMLFLKLGRLCFLLPLVAIYVVDVSKLKNPRIINEVFFQECRLQQTYNPDLIQFNTISTYCMGDCHCCVSALAPSVFHHDGSTHTHTHTHTHTYTHTHTCTHTHTHTHTDTHTHALWHVCCFSQMAR